MEEPVFRLTKKSLERGQQTADDPRTVKEMLRSISREWSDEELRALIYNLERGRGWEAIDTVNPERYLQCLRRSLARHEKAARRERRREMLRRFLKR